MVGGGSGGPEEVEEGLGQEFLGRRPGLGWEPGPSPVLRIVGSHIQAVGPVDDRAGRGTQEGGDWVRAQEPVVFTKCSIRAGVQKKSWLIAAPQSEGLAQGDPGVPK
jgi:hypothetical protein